jgi:membrane protein YqaA with SNARE-associated domain
VVDIAAVTRTLTTRELNRALLARQMLLERVKAPIPQALERMGGLQAQYATSMYIGLWSRVEGLERDAVTRALQRRSIVQGSMMRATIHLVSRRDYWPFVVGIRRGLREWWLRVHKDVSRREIAANDRKVVRALRGKTLSRSELEEVIGKRWAAAGVFVDLVRAPPSGTWERRRADRYALAEDWVGPEDVTEDEGLEHLVRRYLQGFGPARPAEIADWAGLDLSPTRRALERLELRRFRDEQGKELVDLLRLPLPDEETPAPVRFLPVWDATLLVHARRTQVLPERYRARVFNVKIPNSVNTFLSEAEPVWDALLRLHVTGLALVGGIFLLALLAGFVPFISIELALIVSAAAGASIGVLLALVAAAAAGQMIGKGCFFLGGRGAFAWNEGRSQRPRIRLPGFVNRVRHRPRVAAVTVFISAATGVPPFAVVSPLAGGWRLRLSSFLVMGFAGKSARFACLVLLPGTIATLLP